ASRRSCNFFITPRAAGRGDRAQRGGWGAGEEACAAAPQFAEPPHAPSTMLRMVPLPRSVSLRGGGQQRITRARAVHRPPCDGVTVKRSLSLAVVAALSCTPPRAPRPRTCETRHTKT